MEDRLDDAAIRIRTHTAQLFAGLGVQAPSIGNVCMRDRFTLYVIEQYGLWLNTHAGQYGVDWFAHLDDHDQTKMVVRFKKKDIAMLFKLTFGGSNG